MGHREWQRLWGTESFRFRAAVPDWILEFRAKLMTWIQREESEDEDNVTFILELQSKLRLVFCVQMVELLGAKKKIFLVLCAKTKRATLE